MMGFELRKVDDYYGIFNGYNSEFLRWQDLWISEKEVKKYIKKNPFPKDELYSLDDLLLDLKAEGSIIIPTTNKNTAEYIYGLVSYLI